MLSSMMPKPMSGAHITFTIPSTIHLHHLSVIVVRHDSAQKDVCSGSGANVTSALLSCVIVMFIKMPTLISIATSDQATKLNHMSKSINQPNRHTNTATNLPTQKVARACIPNHGLNLDLELCQWTSVMTNGPLSMTIYIVDASLMGLMVVWLLRTLLADAVSKRVLDAATTALHLVRV